MDYILYLLKELEFASKYNIKAVDDFINRIKDELIWTYIRN